MKIRLALFLSLVLPCLIRAEEAQPVVIHLWEKGAPGFEKLKDEPEVMKGSSVTHVNHPSITVFPAPKETANGAAVLIELDREAAIAAAIAASGPKDLVLIAGKGHEITQQIGDVVRDFDDREVARAILRTLGQEGTTTC